MLATFSDAVDGVREKGWAGYAEAEDHPGMPGPAKDRASPSVDRLALQATLSHFGTLGTELQGSDHAFAAIQRGVKHRVGNRLKPHGLCGGEAHEIHGLWRGCRADTHGL